jgi:hypothetical protein
MDVVGAYLASVLDKDIYMTLPNGFGLPDGANSLSDESHLRPK